MRRFLTVLAVCLVLLLVANLVAGTMLSAQAAVDVAYARCGDDVKGLEVKNTKCTFTPRYVVGQTASVEFDVQDKENKDKTRKIRVTLHKAVNFLGWQVAEYEPDVKPG
jgi:hypothetical protein